MVVVYNHVGKRKYSVTKINIVFRNDLSLFKSKISSNTQLTSKWHSRQQMHSTVMKYENKDFQKKPQE